MRAEIEPQHELLGRKVGDHRMPGRDFAEVIKAGADPFRPWLKPAWRGPESQG